VVTEGESFRMKEARAEGVDARQPADPVPGWGLFMATSGDFKMAVDTTQGKTKADIIRCFIGGVSVL
jgi:hypothetical protein